MPAEVTDPVTASQQAFPGRAEQVAAARRFAVSALAGIWPDDGELRLVVSELATNAVLHSASGRPGGTFTVRMVFSPERWLRIEVRDDGGLWNGREPDELRGHGLEIVESVAAECGRDGDEVSGWVVWARLDWPRA